MENRQDYTGVRVKELIALCQNKGALLSITKDGVDVNYDDADSYMNAFVIEFFITFPSEEDLAELHEKDPTLYDGEFEAFVINIKCSDSAITMYLP